jgi:hypothetical protein
MSFLSHIFNFVIYPKGACGQHLSNLINLDETFNSSDYELNKEQFCLYLENFYENYNFNTNGLSKKNTQNIIL